MDSINKKEIIASAELDHHLDPVSEEAFSKIENLAKESEGIELHKVKTIAPDDFTASLTIIYWSLKIIHTVVELVKELGEENVNSETLINRFPNMNSVVKEKLQKLVELTKRQL